MKGVIYVLTGPTEGGTTYAYNTAGDLASTNYSDTTPDVAMIYTRFGAQKTVTDATGTRTLTYTTALRLNQEQLPSFGTLRTRAPGRFSRVKV